jgi:hypothetical protein
MDNYEKDKYIQKLEMLKKQGVISEKDFLRKKQELLNKNNEYDNNKTQKIKKTIKNDYNKKSDKNRKTKKIDHYIENLQKLKNNDIITEEEYRKEEQEYYDKKNKRKKAIKISLTLIGIIILAIIGYAIISHIIESTSNIQSITKFIKKEEGGDFVFKDDVRFNIPPDALYEDTEITITKNRKNTHFKFYPEGLKSKLNMSLIVPVVESMFDEGNRNKLITFYIYSDESPINDTISNKVKSERLYQSLVSDKNIGQYIETDFRHFSLIRSTIQDSAYISFFLPTKYLKKGDILFSLSAENYKTNEEGFDWFPGHVGMVINSNEQGDNIIEAVPPKVRKANLEEDFAFVKHHMYMGARRPKEFSINDKQRESIIKWALKQDGKEWSLLNNWEKNDFKEFSCVGLVEEAYNSIGKPVVGDNLFTIDYILRPLDMYDKTAPINEITEKIGNDIKFRVNPVFLNQDRQFYLDYRDLGKTPDGFKFTAVNLPENAYFNSDTGIFEWEHIPKFYKGEKVEITFHLQVPYMSFFGGTKYERVSETFTINVVDNENYKEKPKLRVAKVYYKHITFYKKSDTQHYLDLFFDGESKNEEQLERNGVFYYHYRDDNKIDYIIRDFDNGTQGKTTYTYDSQGRIIESYTEDEGGHYIRDKYIYNDEGELKKHYRKRKDDGEGYWIKDYDLDGTLIKSYIKYPNGVSDTRTYEYNEEGYTIVDNGVREKDGEILSKFSFTSEYEEYEKEDKYKGLKLLSYTLEQGLNNKPITFTTDTKTKPLDRISTSTYIELKFNKEVLYSDLRKAFSLTRTHDHEIIRGIFDYKKVKGKEDRKTIVFKPITQFIYSNEDHHSIYTGIKPNYEYNLSIFGESFPRFNLNFTTIDLDYGLYWYGEDNKAEKFVPNKENRFYDPDRPTVIYVHGWKKDSVDKFDYGRESFIWGYNGDEKVHDTSKAWRDAGWNVGIFHWNQFADDDPTSGIEQPSSTEAKIWAAKNDMTERIVLPDEVNIRYRILNKKGKDPEFVNTEGINKSIGELFKDTYIKAMKGNRNGRIRLVGHSLGNQLATYLVWLLKEEHKKGKIDDKILPNRLALVDPYYTDGKKTYLNYDTTLTKKVGGDTVSERVVNIVKELISYYDEKMKDAKYPFVIEQYQTSTLSGEILGFIGGDKNLELRDYTTYQRIFLDYVEEDYSWLTATSAHKHNLAPRYYFHSYGFDPPNLLLLDVFLPEKLTGDEYNELSKVLRDINGYRNIHNKAYTNEGLFNREMKLKEKLELSQDEKLVLAVILYYFLDYELKYKVIGVEKGLSANTHNYRVKQLMNVDKKTKKYMHQIDQTQLVVGNTYKKFFTNNILKQNGKETISVKDDMFFILKQ